MMFWKYPLSLRRPCAGALTALLMASALLSAHAYGEPTAAPQAIADKAEQRKLYHRAHTALQQGQTSTYNNLLAQLEHYPLKPYLEYRAITRHMARLPQPQVDDFLTRYQGSYLAERLQRQWVEALAKQQRWNDVVRYHNPDNTTTELSCHALRARIISGDESAYQEVPPLWNVARSQPKACDPVFAAWMKAGLLTPDIAWQRFSKSIKARQHTLARYIARQMPSAEQALADLYYEVDRDPRLLRNQKKFSAQNSHMQEIILHGLERLSLRDASLAMELWNIYDAQQLFEASARLDTQQYIAARLLRQGYTAETEAMLATTPALSSEDLTEWLLRDALRKQDWPRIEKWLAYLPDSARQTERWQYWQARALARHNSEEAQSQANVLYQSLAQTRSFYGFLAADLLELDYQLVDKPIAATDQQLNQLAASTPIQRARELYIIGDELGARREWHHAMSSMTDEQISIAGKLAESWGWHRDGIQAMIQVRYWDDIQLRFPLAYQEHVNVAARATAISPHLLFAIARQESAFIADARSSAGALGLMQLMPATAQQTATRAGMRVSNHDLLQPATNITLGSRYLSQLLNEFNGNRILAAAAYNAGPTRVKQWLSKDSHNSLPFDIWIETIPFRETRGYVQNVLAYSVIYGYRLGDVKPFITEGEADTSL
ncbi:MAG TPA: transglycosylase SLT domain-containing protein [Cellvibrionaceae bacterium]